MQKKKPDDYRLIEDSYFRILSADVLPTTLLTELLYRNILSDRNRIYNDTFSVKAIFKSFAHK